MIENGINAKSISLRRIRADDAKTLVSLASQFPRQVEHFSFWQRVAEMTREEAIRAEYLYLYRISESSTDKIYAIIDTNSKSLYGTIGIHEFDIHNNNARIGYILFDGSVGGQGIMAKAVELFLRKAFCLHKIEKLYAHVYVENNKGLALDIGMGFRAVGTRRSHYKLSDGSYQDVELVEQTRKEWEARTGNKE